MACPIDIEQLINYQYVKSYYIQFKVTTIVTIKPISTN